MEENSFNEPKKIAAILVDWASKSRNIHYLCVKYKTQSDIINSILSEHYCNKELTDQTEILTVSSLLNTDDEIEDDISKY